MTANKCLNCQNEAQDVWVPGDYGRPGHHCSMCAECCEFEEYWRRVVARGREDAMRAQLLRTQARGRAARLRRLRPGS